MTHSHRAISLVLAVMTAAWGLPAPNARAERADRGKPLVLEADHASYDDLKQAYRLTGNVVLTKGSMVLRADAADLSTDPEGYQHATAIAKPGNLAFIRQKRDSVDEYIQGWGERIEYNGKQETAKLIRHARMERLQGAAQLDEIRGAVITYDGQQERYTASGNAQNAATASPDGRVRAILAPRSSASGVSARPARP